MEGIAAFNKVLNLIRNMCRTCGANFNGSKNKWACCACPMYIFKWTLKFSFKQKVPLRQARVMAECYANNEMVRITQQVKKSFKEFMLQNPAECWQEFGYNLDKGNLQDFFNEWLYMEEIPLEKLEEVSEIDKR